MKNHYECIVMGGGLAGLLFSRQLKQRNPELKIAVIDRQKRPLPLACHKVGESVVEGATHFMSQTLGLKNYLDRHHIPKLGLRVFGGGGSKVLHKRFELGAVDFPPVPSVQIDRGMMENDLRKMAIKQGIKLYEGYTIDEFEFGQPHRVRIKKGKSETTLKSRWIVDASGWRRLIQKKLKLEKPSEHKCSSNWWRVAGRVDYGDFCKDANRDWKNRTKHPRWYSTNHVMGKGYWIWMIPLGSINTSIGIVADEKIHPVAERKNWPLTLKWLQKNEPFLAKHLAKHPPIDFLAMKNFAHKTKQVFSADRWACVGPSAAFTDPLYSMGSDLIGWSSTITCNLIEDDLKKNPDYKRRPVSSYKRNVSRKKLSLYESIFQNLIDDVTVWYVDQFKNFDHDTGTLAKILWDGLIYFSFPSRVLIQNVLDSPQSTKEMANLLEKLSVLNRKVQGSFKDWRTTDHPKAAKRGFYNPAHSCPSVRPLVLYKGVTDRQPRKEFIKQQKVCLALLEQVAFSLDKIRTGRYPSDKKADRSQIKILEKELRNFLFNPIEKFRGPRLEEQLPSRNPNLQPPALTT